MDNSKTLKNTFGALVLGFALSGSACSAAKTTPSGSATKSEQSVSKITYVDANEAHELLTSKAGATVIDIRTPEEIGQGYIDGAVFANFFDADFKEQLTRLDKDVAYIVHCRSGGRSTKALTAFRDLGFKNVAHMDGGYNGWAAAGLPVTQP